MSTQRQNQILRDQIAAWQADPTFRARRALSRVLFLMPEMREARELLDDPSNGPAEMAGVFGNWEASAQIDNPPPSGLLGVN